MSSTSLFHEGRELCSVQRYHRLPQPKSKSTAKLMPLTGLKKALCKYPDIPHSYIIGPLIHSCMYKYMHTSNFLYIMHPSLHTYLHPIMHTCIHTCTNKHTHNPTYTHT